MRFVSISDVHIKEPGDKAELLFLKFLDHPDTLESEIIFLLGDIFDLLVGKGFKIEKRYFEIFSRLRNLLQKGKKIYQFEGNHDFHFKSLTEDLCYSWGVDSSLWKYERDLKVLQFEEKKILFAHGDEIEIGNYSYKIYKFFIRSFFINFLANSIVSPRLVQSIGDRASAKSRKRNEKRYSEEEMGPFVRQSFQRAAEQSAKKYSADVVICGHSHCKDHFIGPGVEYLNNGYVPLTKSFISYKDGNFKIKNLETCK